MKLYQEHPAPGHTRLVRMSRAGRIAAAVGLRLVVVLALSGCGESTKPIAAPPVAMVDDKSASAETPTDKVLVVPRPDLNQGLKIYSTGLERRRSNLLTAMSFNGGTAVLHAMVYQDSSWKEAINGKPKNYREIRAYHLHPWSPARVKEEIQFDEKAKVADYRFRPERICIFEARPEGLRVRTGAVPGWSQFTPDPSSGIIDYRAWSAFLPRALESEYTIIPAELVKGTSHSKRSFTSSKISSSFGSAIRRIPGSVAMKETLSVVSYDDFSSTEVDISIECLPIPNPVSTAELLALAEEWRKEAAGDPKDAAARYYFGWVALFGYDRITRKDPLHRQLLIDGEKFVAESCALEPDDQANVALQRKLIVERIRDDYGQNPNGAIADTEQLLKLRPTSDDCLEALEGLRRYSPIRDQPLADVALRLLRRQLDWYSEWPEEQNRELEFRRKQYDSEFFSVVGLEPLLKEYEAKSSKSIE